MDDKSPDERVVIRAPKGATLAIEKIAIRARTTPGELARRILIDGLRANGYDLSDEATLGFSPR